MKKALFTFILVISNIIVFAQLQPYQPDPFLDKFTGTWVAKTGKKEITIIIKKIQVPFMNTKADQLEGYLVHKDNNSIIEQSTDPTFTLGNNVSVAGKVYNDRVFFSYFDRKKNKTGKVQIVLTNSSANEFILQLDEESHFGPVTFSKEKKQRGFTLPQKLVFKKQ